jgi:hypothetical protein
MKNGIVRGCADAAPCEVMACPLGALTDFHPQHLTEFSSISSLNHLQPVLLGSEFSSRNG